MSKLMLKEHLIRGPGIQSSYIENPSQSIVRSIGGVSPVSVLFEVVEFLDSQHKSSSKSIGGMYGVSVSCNVVEFLD